MEEHLTMSKKEHNRLEVMQRIKEKRLTQKEAAQKLGLSVRQVKRLYSAYRQQGAGGLVSKRRGKPSNNRLDADVEQQAIDLIHERYRDFGPTLAHEKLVEVHGLLLSSARVLSVYHIRLFSPLKGDISTLEKWGHFYFDLTEKVEN